MMADRVLMAVSLKALMKKVAAGGGPPSLSRDRLNPGVSGNSRFP